MNVAGQTSSVAGTSIHWLKFGEPTRRPPVVLLHGLNDCHLTWKSVAEELARDRLVFVPDLPGHGLSARPDVSYTLTWYAKFMGEWMGVVGLEKADVVGHSFGGGIAQVMLLECRSRIRRLSLVSSGGLGREISFALRLASIPYVVERLGQPFMAIGTRLAVKCSGGKRVAHVVEMSSMNAQAGTAMAFARTVHDIIGWRGQRQTYHERIHQIAQLPPMHVFWGERDGIIPVSHGKLMAGAFDGIGLTLFKGGGHFVHSEMPERFAKELRLFLDEPSLPPAQIRATAKKRERSCPTTI